MITERRVFQAKPGAAEPVLAKLKEAQPILAKLDLESSLSQDSEFLKTFENWFESLTQLIEGATVKLWRREV